MPLQWTRHSKSGKLAAAAPRGLYTISRGGANGTKLVLRFLAFTSSAEPKVLGIYEPGDEALACDEARDHNERNTPCDEWEPPQPDHVRFPEGDY